VDAISSSDAGGVEAEIWKNRGIDDARTPCDGIAHLVRNAGRDASQRRPAARVRRQGRRGGSAPEPGLEGYIGFAIGRSNLHRGVKAYAPTRKGSTAEAAVGEHLANYTCVFIEVSKQRHAAV